MRIGAMYQGTSISTLQPSASSLTACRQLPSQSVLKWLSPVITASLMSLLRVTMKLYAMRPSPSKSTIRFTRSSCACSSRRIRWCVRGTPAGWMQRKAIAKPLGVDSTGFGRQAGRVAVERLHLAEIGDVPDAAPLGWIDAPVDLDPGAAVGGLGRPHTGTAEQQQRHDRQAAPRETTETVTEWEHAGEPRNAALDGWGARSLSAPARHAAWQKSCQPSPRDVHRLADKQTGAPEGAPV
ncbi:hypothetical protein ACO2Q2_03575 [Dyella sp. KRB-257]|uniref:hypothetical protein n=1 Tax=Dyella sp. KRB-257 TaxID=3400915 RepID=UPI003C12AD0C